MEKYTILIIEDELALKEALATAMKDAGFTVYTAGDGEEGLRLALKHGPDAILLDLLLPKMPGMEMLKKLRADARGKHIPVIILSNASEPVNVMDAMKNEVFDYLVKSDWSLAEVTKKVKEKIANRQK